MSGWWHNKVSLGGVSPQERQRLELLASEQFLAERAESHPDAEKASRACAVLRGIIEVALDGSSPEEIGRRLVLCWRAAGEMPGPLADLAKKAGCSQEHACRSIRRMRELIQHTDLTETIFEPESTSGAVVEDVAI